MIYFFIVLLITSLVAYTMAEIMHYRKGHDVYDWTKQLANWLDKK